MDGKIAIGHLLTDVMVFDTDMFDVGVLHVVFGKFGSGIIVTE